MPVSSSFASERATTIEADVAVGKAWQKPRGGHGALARLPPYLPAPSWGALGTAVLPAADAEPAGSMPPPVQSPTKLPPWVRRLLAFAAGSPSSEP